MAQTSFAAICCTLRFVSPSVAQQQIEASGTWTCRNKTDW